MLTAALPVAANLQLAGLPVRSTSDMPKPQNLYAVVAATVALATPAVGQTTPSYTQADVRFMQGMIGHHAQALAMVALIPSRTARPDLRALGERIRVSQTDEIALMKQWLYDRNQQIPADMSDAHDMSGHAMQMPGMTMSDSLMPGMLTPQQMTQLANATGADFEVLFLKDMIQHHEGALTMVARLLDTTGSGQEPEVFRFAAEVDTDQRAEIARMNALLTTLQPTPTTR
jgi:uncharacterized protein (DUF305 family)